jgi:hypothetical protein
VITATLPSSFPTITPLLSTPVCVLNVLNVTDGRPGRKLCRPIRTERSMLGA